MKWTERYTPEQKARYRKRANEYYYANRDFILKKRRMKAAKKTYWPIEYMRNGKNQ